MLNANATVMHLGKIEMVNVGSSPIRRPRTAVEYKENVDATAIDVKISAACLFTSWSSQQHKIILDKDTNVENKTELIILQVNTNTPQKKS
jgi:hypothetical protein